MLSTPSSTPAPSSTPIASQPSTMSFPRLQLAQPLFRPHTRPNIVSLPAALAVKSTATEVTSEQEAKKQQDNAHSDDESSSDWETDHQYGSDDEHEVARDYPSRAEAAYSDDEASDHESSESSRKYSTSSNHASHMQVCKEDNDTPINDGFEYDLAKNERVEYSKSATAQQRNNRKRKATEPKRASCHRCQTKPGLKIQLFECLHLREKPVRGKPSTSSRKSPSSALPTSKCSFLYCTEERCLKGLSEMLRKLGALESSFRNAADMEEYFRNGSPCPHCLGLENCENSNCRARCKKLVESGKYELKAGHTTAATLKSEVSGEKVKKERSKAKSKKAVPAPSATFDDEDDYDKDDDYPRAKKAKKSKQARKSKKHRKSSPSRSASLLDEDDEEFMADYDDKPWRKPSRMMSSSSSSVASSPVLSFANSSHSSPPPLDAQSPPQSPSSLRSSPPTPPPTAASPSPPHYMRMAPLPVSVPNYSNAVMPIAQRSSTLAMPHSPQGGFHGIVPTGPLMFGNNQRGFRRDSSFSQLTGPNGIHQDMLKANMSLYSQDKTFQPTMPTYTASHSSALFPSASHPLLHHQQQAMHMPLHHTHPAHSAAGGYYSYSSQQMYGSLAFPMSSSSMSSVTAQQSSNSNSTMLMQQRKFFTQPQFPSSLMTPYPNSALPFTPTASHANLNSTTPSTVRATN